MISHFEINSEKFLKELFQLLEDEDDKRLIFRQFSVLLKNFDDELYLRFITKGKKSGFIVDFNMNRYEVSSFSLQLLLLLVCKKECIEVIKLLLSIASKKEINIIHNPILRKKIDECQTPLLIVCEKGNLEILELFLIFNNNCKSKIDINQPGSYGETPIFVACIYENLEIVKSLSFHFGKNINVNKSTNLGDSPFNITCYNGYLEIVELLLTIYIDKININKVDVYGNTPLDDARENGDLELVELLTQNGAKYDHSMKIGKNGKNCNKIKTILSI